MLRNDDGCLTAETRRCPGDADPVVPHAHGHSPLIFSQDGNASEPAAHLDAPVGWKVSSLSEPSAAIGLDTTGVGANTECTVCQANSKSPSVGTLTALVVDEEFPVGTVMV